MSAALLAGAPRMALPREIMARQPAFAWAGLAGLLLGLLCLALMAVDTRLFAGVSVWVKPAKFALSFALWFWTLAWLWPALPRDWREGWQGRATVAAMLGAALFEQGYITVRAALGRASQFAINDPFGAVMYALMGVGATLLVALVAWMGVVVLRRGDPAWSRMARLGAGWGLLLGGVLGGAAGWAISLNGSPWVLATESNAAGLPLLGWSRDGGDLRIAHFLGMHAMQAMPLAAALFGLRGFALATVGWAAATVFALAWALAGRPFF